jgi:hypothetical protein
MGLPLSATAAASLMLASMTVRDWPLAKGGPREVFDPPGATSLTFVASLPAGWHSLRNPAPARLDWTNAGPFLSSMRSLAERETNRWR